MDALLDVASTSDADERELLEAANSDLYWDRVTAKRYPRVKLDFHPPNAMSGQGDDTQLRTSRVYRRSTPVEDTHSSSISHPGPHTSSSPPPHGSPCPTVPESLTTPGYTGIEQPTSPPASSFLVASTSISSLPHRPPGRLRHGATGSYSIGSPDPLQLFSSPMGHHVDPGGHHSSPTDRDAALHLASSPVTLGRGQIAGPGEFSSPSEHLREHLRDHTPQPINLRQRAPSPDPFVAPPTDDFHHDGTLAPENAANASGGRYSMRTRQPRQLKPYAFDRLAYNHQLKYHPDAIVKFRGHHSPVGSSSPSSSHSSESDIDAAVGNSGGERPFGATQTLARAKGKKRPRANREHPPNLSPTAHRRTSGVQPAGGSPSLGRRFPGSPAVANPARATPISDLGSDNRPEEAITWYPDAYDDLSSGLGSDELPFTAQNDLHVDNTLPSRVKRRRRGPRQLPQLSPLASPPRELSVSASPPPKPASLGVISLHSSSSESSSGSESTGGSDDVALLSEGSAVMLVDDHSSLSSKEPERSPPQTFRNRRLQPSRYPVITDFFGRGHRDKKKKPRKRGIVPPDKDKASRPKRTAGGVRARDPQSADRRNSKTRPRRRHEHPQRPADLSVFTVAGGRVLSGWHKRNAVTIDTEDITFQRALEPLERRARPFPNRPPSGPPHIRHPPRQALRGPINQNASSSTSRVVDPVPDGKTRHRIAVDFDIPLLSSGLVYATSSYLGKGWLHELLSIVSGTPPSHPPPTVEVDGHVLSSVSTALDYTVFLPYSCDSFAKVLDNPLAMSREAFTNWNANMHAVCSLVSWILASAVGNDAHLIRTASVEYTGSLIARIDSAIEDYGDRAKALASSILCLQWFGVELLVRSCLSATDSDEDLSTTINSRVVGMANRLLQVDIQAAILHVATNNGPLDDFFLYPCVAELWICLVHLGTVHGRTPLAPRQSIFPWIVKILPQSLADAESSVPGGLHTSEEIWRTLFGLCALSQFSAHGVSTSSARMDTSWELALLALDYIRLVADPQIDSGLSARSLRRRDAYIRMVVSRCLILHQRWRWRLDDDASATLFRRLVEIFKSRKFADLRGEIAGFPAFVQENDARLLADHASADSAFTIFLKLIFAAAEQMRPSLREDEYLGRTKKLLSLVTPVGSVQLSALRSPFDEQLSMLYNRFSSLALAIRILPSPENMLYRLSLAHRYIDFGRSVAATRSVCIRAANFLALQALDVVLPVGPALDWTSEMAQVLISEFREAVAVVPGAFAAPLANSDARRRRTELVQCTQLLLSGLHDMSRVTTTSPGNDTSPALELLQKGCLFLVLAEAELCAIPTIQTLLQGIVDAHLNHTLSLQEERPQQEQHPQPGPANQEESQDEYGQFDLDWNDPMVVAALNNAVEPAPITVPVPAVAMQYTYQSLIEHLKNVVASPIIFDNIISAFESQRQRQ